MPAINYYQPWLKPFLQHAPSVLPRGIKEYYYYSWEDGLWDLLKNKFPEEKGLVFLIPDFYCIDVVINIQARGHKVYYYRLNKDFQIDEENFAKEIKYRKPDVAVIFSACGITSNLLEHKSWVRHLKDKAIILEDAVHRLIDPKEITLINERHVVMDSLRKVSPLPGSRMFGAEAMLNFRQAPHTKVNFYLLKSLWWYINFRFVLSCGFWLKNSRMLVFAHEELLDRHDAIIGDEAPAQPGLGILKPLVNRINPEAIRKVKNEQAKLYEKYLTKVWKNKFFYKVKIERADFPYLHVYPLGFRLRPKKKLEKLLHDNGIAVWYKYTESPWSRNKSVLFLPLGFHITEADIAYTAEALEKYAAI